MKKTLKCFIASLVIAVITGCEEYKAEAYPFTDYQLEYGLYVNEPVNKFGGNCGPYLTMERDGKVEFIKLQGSEIMQLAKDFLDQKKAFEKKVHSRTDSKDESCQQ